MRASAWILVACFAAAGCAGTFKSMPRWLVVTDPRTEVALAQNSATAIVGDNVYIEVGRSVFDPDTKGYQVYVDGRKYSHPEWDEKETDLRFRYRAQTVGNHEIVVLIPQGDAEPTRRTCILKVQAARDSSE